MKTIKETAENVVQFPVVKDFTEDERLAMKEMDEMEVTLTEEEKEINRKTQALLEPQLELIAKTIEAIVDTIDDISVKKKEEDPDFDLLVHIPLESLFTAVPMFLNHTNPMTKEEVDRNVPLVEQLSFELQQTVDRFFEKHGMHLPSDIALFAFSNAAVTLLEQQRIIIAYERVTGVELEDIMEAEDNEN